MEVLETQNAENNVPGGFLTFLKKKEQNCSESLLNRKNRHLRRFQMKQQWLFRSKIIPPTFFKIGDENMPKFKTVQNILPITSPQNSRKTTPFSDMQDETKAMSKTSYRALVSPIRPQCKTSHAALRNISSCNRLKSNWKLQFRLDELNVLKYKKEDETVDVQNKQSDKNFKLRKMHKKFITIRPQLFQLYKNNLDLSKQNRSPSPKNCYQGINP